MLLVLEIGMLIGGIYSVVTATVSGFLIDGGKYQVNGKAARFLGIMLMIPVLSAFFGGIFMAQYYPENAAGNAFVVEFLTISFVVVLTLIFVRVAGTKRVPAIQDVEIRISKKTNGALLYAMFTWTGFASIVCSPFAFIYATQALKLMDEYQVGEQYRRKAQGARFIAVIAPLMMVACIAMLVFSGVLS